MRENRLASCTSHTLVSTLGFAGRCLYSGAAGSTVEKPASGGATVTHCAEASVAGYRTDNAAARTIPNQTCLCKISPAAEEANSTAIARMTPQLPSLFALCPLRARQARKAHP